MDYSIGKGYYPGVGITVDPPKGGGNGKSSSSSSSEEFSKKTKDLTKHAEASSPPSTPRAPSKGISIDKLADLRVGYDFIFKKSTIDLPKGTSPPLARALAEAIGRRLGESEPWTKEALAWDPALGKKEKHPIKVTKTGSHYQIRFWTEKGGVGPESIQAFIRRLITACKDLGIEDEAALARFVRKCPMLASAFGDGRIWFRYGPTIESVMTSHQDEACVREALKQKNFSFIGLFIPCLREHRSSAYEVAVSATFKDAQRSISAMNSAADKKDFKAAQKNLDAAKSVLICLAKLSHRDPAVEKRLLEFVVNNWKDFPEITDIVHPHLSDQGKKSVESLVATINFEGDYESLLKEIDEAGLETRIEGGFHFARKDGQALDLHPAHLKLAMRLAALWAINKDDNLEHAFGIMKYVFDKAESDLKKPIAKLMESIKSSPLPQVRARYEQIDAVVARFKQKTLLVEKASELKQKFGYGIQKDNESGNYRLESRDDDKTMKARESQALRMLVVFAAKAGEVALIVDSIRLVQSARLGFSDQSNQEVARDLYRTAMGWLRDFAPEAVADLKKALGKEFRSQVASDISEMVKEDFLKAKDLFNDFKDDTLIHELIQLIPANQRKGLAEKPTIDDVLVRLLNRKAG
jgi:hypothetical protein